LEAGMEIELSNDGVWKEVVVCDEEVCLFTCYAMVDDEWENQSSYSVDLAHIKRIAAEVE